MADFESLTSAELLKAQAQSWELLLSVTTATSIKCATQLGIFDIIHKHGKPMPFSELLAALPISPSKASYLHRFLSVLVHSGLLLVKKSEGEQEEEEEVVGHYSLTPAALLLQRPGVPDIPHFLLKGWESLGDWFQNEEQSPVFTAFRKNFWELTAQQPSSAYAFNETMAQDSKFIAKVLLDKCKHVFEGLTTLVDVGGGTGIVAMAIAKSFPNLECIVLDRPHVVANLHGSDNLKFVSGDMFEKIPHANAILLKWILHDWKDEECIKILKKCKEAIPRKEEGGKVIIIDIVMGYPGLEPEFVKAQMVLDMLMLVTLGTKERYKNQWEKLFSAAGFSDYNITPALGSRCLIELYP